MDYKNLKESAKKEFEKISSASWESYNTETLKGKAPSKFESLDDVPLNTETATLYAMEVTKPDNSMVIYVGSYAQPLSCRPGTGINLDYSNTLGIVSAIKNLYTGKIIRFGDSDYAPFIEFAGTN